MLLRLTQLAGVPVKVSPHRSLNTSRGVIRSRDKADCNVEEIVQELQPQGVTAASIIHVRDGDSRRRTTNTLVLTFASPQPPKHITAGYLRVPVKPYIPNPLRCFKCQKYGHSSRVCKSTALCVRCGESGHEAAHCKNQKSASIAKVTTLPPHESVPNGAWNQRVQQIKVERGTCISFPDARKAVLSEQSANTSSKKTAASVILSTTTTQQSQKKTTSISTQTELTWPEGADTPVPVKTNSQTTQTHSNKNSAKNTGIPPPLLLHQEVTEVQMLQ